MTIETFNLLCLGRLDTSHPQLFQPQRQAAGISHTEICKER